MEKKITFVTDDLQKVDFFVLEQTKVNGISYLLVADSEEDDAECLILKDCAKETDTDSLYEIVEDDVELNAVLKIFEELLEDVDFER
ncbi:MAG: DUF1292 domain-containing protein [Dorea sp.]|nr:DUF1292 domain-containing protein [Dorea sp.]